MVSQDFAESYYFNTQKSTFDCNADANADYSIFTFYIACMLSTNNLATRSDWKSMLNSLQNYSL